MAWHCTVYVKNKVNCSWFWHIGASPSLKLTSYGVFVFLQKPVDVQYGGPTFLHHHWGPRDDPTVPVHLCKSTTHSFLLCHAVHCFDFPWHMWTYTSTLSALHQDCITLTAPLTLVKSTLESDTGAQTRNPECLQLNAGSSLKGVEGYAYVIGLNIVGVTLR